MVFGNSRTDFINTNTLTKLALTAMFAVLTSTAGAVTLNETSKILALDAAPGDNFGSSTAASGNIAVVGARGDDDAGASSGSAYVFDTTTGNQLFKLTAADAAAGDSFGVSVAVSGNTAIVGALFDADAGLDSGSAYLFDTTTGNQSFKLTAADAAAEDFFGASVAISGNTAIVGADENDGVGIDAGAAYLFDTTTGNQLFKLTASDAAEDDGFGNSVALSGTTAIVGAHFDNNMGSAYLFDTTTGNQLLKLTASDAALADGFGSSVAISGNIAIVGADYNDDAGNNSGSAYLFDTTTGNQLFKLTASDAEAHDQFGLSVAISGNMAIVGAPFNDDAGNISGSAYVFDVTTGNELFKLAASDASTSDVFGFAVALSGNIAVAGPTLEGVIGSPTSSVYLFDVPLSGDFDLDGDVDGADFLKWQRGESPAPLSASDLALWEANFGTTTAPATSSATSVPEPSSLLLGSLAAVGLLLRRRVAG